MTTASAMRIMRGILQQIESPIITPQYAPPSCVDRG
jgi:hypothetical protein